MNDLDRSFVKPKLNRADALKVASKNLQDKGFAVKFLRNVEDELFIYQDGKKTRLVYVVSYLLANSLQPSRPFTMLDAHSGEIIDRWEGIAHAQIGTGPGGNEKRVCTSTVRITTSSTCKRMAITVLWSRRTLSRLT